jgi:hypothetical protein
MAFGRKLPQGVFSCRVAHRATQLITAQQLVQTPGILIEISLRHYISCFLVSQPIPNPAYIKSDNGLSMDHGFNADEPKGFRPHGADGHHLGSGVIAA